MLACIFATTAANTAAAHMKMNLQHYYKTLHGPKADPVELNLWTMIPMSTTARGPERCRTQKQTEWMHKRIRPAFIRNCKDMA